MVKSKELTNSVKEVVNKKWKLGKSYTKLPQTLNTLFTTIKLLSSSEMVVNKFKSGKP